MALVQVVGRISKADLFHSYWAVRRESFERLGNISWRVLELECELSCAPAPATRPVIICDKPFDLWLRHLRPSELSRLEHAHGKTLLYSTRTELFDALRDVSFSCHDETLMTEQLRNLRIHDGETLQEFNDRVHHEKGRLEAFFHSPAAVAQQRRLDFWLADLIGQRVKEVRDHADSMTNICPDKRLGYLQELDGLASQIGNGQRFEQSFSVP
ncbi:uncharacterized protein BKA78DRAFT_357963 [Phyllosticta capitalensis]|uniref:uncharacterized protein n=1 Tax=Phyllosticta capitalensis TaxID=121624 RepID=UPI00312D8384